MTVAPENVLLRWSSTRVCPRKAIYEATNAPARERTDREARILFRGRSLGRDYVSWLRATHGNLAVLDEVKVEWELGVGHMDAFLVPTKTAIEVLSSAIASEPMIASKLLQLVGYMEHYPDAENGCLIVLNPSDFGEERFPVAKGTERYAELVAQMNERVAEVLRWRDEGTMPERVCAKPSEAIGRFCLHAEHCFEGWQPERAIEHTSPELLEQARAVFAAKSAEREARGVLSTLEATRKETEAELAALLDGQPAKIHCGPFVVTRTDVQRQPSFDWRKAELAGVFEPGLYGEFFKPGAAYSTWRIEKTEDVGAIDYGEETPF